MCTGVCVCVCVCVYRCVDIDECSQKHNCSMLCINLPGSYRCDCRDAYRLSSDDISCDDVNECVEKTDWCQQLCVNNDGSFLCQCRPGYTLSAKGGVQLVPSPIASDLSFRCCIYGLLQKWKNTQATTLLPNLFSACSLGDVCVLSCSSSSLFLVGSLLRWSRV